MRWNKAKHFLFFVCEIFCVCVPKYIDKILGHDILQKVFYFVINKST